MHSSLVNISNSNGSHLFFSASMTFHQRTALSPTGPLSSTNAPWRRWCCPCQVLWTRTLVGHLVHSHTQSGVSRVEWSDVTLGCLSSPVNVLVDEWPSPSGSVGHWPWTGHRHGIWPKVVYLSGKFPVFPIHISLYTSTERRVDWLTECTEAIHLKDRWHLHRTSWE